MMWRPLLLAVCVALGEASSGGYEKYMKQYAGASGGYEKYMKQFADKYMKQYTGGNAGSADYSKYYQKYMHQSGGASQLNTTIDLSASQKKSQGGYEKYMKQYAGSSGGYDKYMKQYTVGNGGYDKYMKQYAGSTGGYDKYMKQYSSNGGYEKYTKQYAGGSQGSAGGFDYQKYMGKNWKEVQQSQTNLNAIRNPQDAKTKEDLDKWKKAQYQNLGQFVPAAYQHFADSTIEQQYQQRLIELQNTTTAGTTDSSETQETSNDSPKELEPASTEKGTAQEATDAATVQNLLEQSPNEEQDEVTKLRNSSKEGVEKVEKLVNSLKHAASDSKAMDEAADMPSQNVQAEFSKRRDSVSNTVKTLQDKVNSGTAVSEDEFTHAEELIEKLGTDQRKALRHAHVDAYKSAVHAARGIQSKVRNDARKVETKTYNLARISSSDQGLANKLQTRIEAATDSAEEQGELLARKTENSLDKSLSKAQESVRRKEQTDLETLHSLRLRMYDQQGTQSKRSSILKTLSEKAAESRSSATKFMAQRVENTGSNPRAALALFALAAGASALVMLYTRFRKSQAQPKTAGLLGYSEISS